MLHILALKGTDCGGDLSVGEISGRNFDAALLRIPHLARREQF
jgi:hypothetical protein